MQYRAVCISWVKGSVCFVLKFALTPFSPPLPSRVQYRAEVFLGSKVPCSLFWNLHFLPFLPSPLWSANFKAHKTFHTRRSCTGGPHNWSLLYWNRFFKAYSRVGYGRSECPSLCASGLRKISSRSAPTYRGHQMYTLGMIIQKHCKISTGPQFVTRFLFYYNKIPEKWLVYSNWLFLVEPTECIMVVGKFFKYWVQPGFQNLVLILGYILTQVPIFIQQAIYQRINRYTTIRNKFLKFLSSNTWKLIFFLYTLWVL